MQIDKQEIVNLLRERGEHDKAEKAKNELPDKVDHEEHGGLLDSIGIDPQDVVSKIKL